ncbi:nicotinamide riboside transporter PnuC [Horticoccus luteus]|uniref:Nicotinamide riboside transporter PnuC n=1 Tax=Horticoccus luteus TaxID=2862869 RepID=A0A8F9XKH6_9BACT|nr:nicotinamide riboside transporter PnuC [Horticoccus luteus]QYM79703.1 nicotinamide riboside transporter PnuC [Horticoccus luteus]
MNEVEHNILAGFVDASALDLANLVLGVVGVWLMIRRTLWAFPVGLVAVTVQGVLFWRSHFPADALLQVFFFVTLAWGWWHWARGGRTAADAAGETKAELPVGRLTWRGWLVTLGLATGAMVAWATMVGPWMGAAMPWRDAFIAMFSVAAQVLQARKNVENWPLWLAVNGVAIVSYWSAALAFTAFLYAIYLGLAVAGWRAWRKALRVQDAERAGAAAEGLKA